jgi:AraC-like DNA-binding protein
MKYQEFRPSPHLADEIRCYWILEQDYSVTDPLPEPILPDGCPEMIFNLAAPCRRHYFDQVEVQPQSMIIGQMKHFVVIEPDRTLKIFGVRFQPFGIYSLIKQPLSELTNQNVSLDAVLGKLGCSLEARINEASTTGQRISIFEQLYEKYICKNNKGPNLLKDAVQTIVAYDGQIQIKEMADRLGTNFKQLERQFKRQIGLTPKSFSRIIRLQKLLGCLNQTADNNWPGHFYQTAEPVNRFFYSIKIVEFLQ